LAVACALSDRPVGVDVQDWSPRHLSIVTRVCTQQEQAFLERSPNQETEFAKLWTRKESYGKYTGKGILYSMNEQPLLTQAPDGTIMETVTFDGYALSYCAEEALKIQRVTLADLLQGRKER
jgi:4'-phosphopantetheinyl transferase